MVDETFSKSLSDDILKKIKIAILGKGVVGKSSLTFRFIGYNAPKKHDATIEDRYSTNMELNQVIYSVEILDTAGEDGFQNMLDMWINFGDGFVLVFAINDPESFEALRSKRERIMKINKSGQKIGPPPILLVGNKQDLAKERKISLADASALAEEWGVEYIETSAKTNFNCREAFEKITKKIIEYKIKEKEYEESRKNCCCCCDIV